MPFGKGGHPAPSTQPDRAGVGPKLRAVRPETGPPHNVRFREIQVRFLIPLGMLNLASDHSSEEHFAAY